MRLVIEFIVNDTKVCLEELQAMAEGLVKNFKKRYKHVGVKILPHFSETGFHTGWKIMLIAVSPPTTREVVPASLMIQWGARYED